MIVMKMDNIPLVFTQTNNFFHFKRIFCETLIGFLLPLNAQVNAVKEIEKSKLCQVNLHGEVDPVPLSR